jgi:DNA-directed RNA polymerase subunit RPC12/RpoP
MKKIVFEECPYCNSKLLVYGYQHNNANVFSDVRGGVFGSPVQHIICRECGSIIYSSVVRPEVFKECVTDEAKELLKTYEQEKPVKKKEGILEIIVDD